MGEYPESIPSACDAFHSVTESKSKNTRPIGAPQRARRAYGVAEQEQTAVNGGLCRQLRQRVQDVNQYALDMDIFSPLEPAEQATA
jgi:hypothetical protein